MFGLPDISLFIVLSHSIYIILAELQIKLSEATKVEADRHVKI
jgi:hypothetical protein